MNKPGLPPTEEIVLHVADYSSPYAGAFIVQLGMLDDEMRRRGAGKCAFAFPTAAASTPWFAEMKQRGSWMGVLTRPPGRLGAGSAREIVPMIQATGANILHAHFGSFDIPSAVAARWAGKRSGPCQTVWHYRTALEEELGRRSPTRRAKDLLKYRLMGSRIDQCLAVTNGLAGEASARGLGRKAVALISGCDTDAFAPNPEARSRIRASLGVEDDQVLVLHLGWSWHRKGGDLLSEAAAILRARGRDGLVFASVGGEGPPDGLVRMLPFTDGIHEVQAAADIFVSASRSEGFGNGLVEALACGSVAVATLVQGQREIFEGLPGCISVPPEDALAIADGIDQLLDRRIEWSRLGSGNREHVVANYDMRRWARDVADVYERLLGDRCPA